MLLRAILSGGRLSNIDGRSRSMRLFFSKYVGDEIRRIFQRVSLQEEKQKLLDELVSPSGKQRSFRLRDIATILQSSAKCGVKPPFKFLAAELKKSKDDATMINVSRSMYGLKSIKKDSDPECWLMVAALVSTVQTCHESFDSQAVGNALYGLQNLTCDRLEVLQLLSVLIPLVKSCKEKLSGQQVGNALYGLKNMSSDHPEVLQLLSVLILLVNSCEGNLLSGQGVGNALYGLQNMSSDHPEVLQMLSALAPLVKSCEEKLSGQEVGNALYGLKNMSSDHPEVLQLLSVLILLVKSCDGRLSGQNIGNALYGLQNMSSDHPEVLQLLSALAPLVKSCEGKLSGQEVGNSLYGLKNMSSGHPEVLQLLSVLVPLVKSCDAKLSGQEVGNAMYGLQNICSDHPEVLQLLSALAPLVKSCDANLSEQNIGNALYGLQNMNSDHPEVLQLLSALIPLVKSCEGKLSGQGVGNALYGLQNMSSDCPEVAALCSVLMPMVIACGSKLSCQNIGNSLFGLSNMDVACCKPVMERLVAMMFDVCTADKIGHLKRSDLSPLISGVDSLLESDVYAHAPWAAELEALQRALSAQLQSQDCPAAVSRSEVRAIRAAQKLFAEASWKANEKIPKALRGVQVYVESNIWLHGYEADIVLRIGGEYRGAKIADTVVNVEVDGPRHDSLKSQRHSRTRDWRMRRQGLLVERWKVRLLDKAGKTESLLLELVQRVVAQSLKAYSSES